MDDAKRTLLSTLLRKIARNSVRFAQTIPETVVADAPHRAARPHVSLKARMLGGQAETIMRFGGLSR